MAGDGTVTLLIRRVGESVWREPLIQHYKDEAALQALLAASPGLLPGVDPERCVVAREVHLGEGFADLVAVDADGEITVVECKLHTNQDMRRTVVGQLLAYAAALWQLSFDDFEAVMAARGVRFDILAEQAQTVDTGSTAWDVVRELISATLATGQFRLVIAVDNFTAELRSIIEYLNTHTSANVQVLGLELAYVADEGVEVLVPRVFGEETAQSKSSGARNRRKWTEEELRSALLLTPPEVRSAFTELFERTRGHPKFDHWYWGDGRFPSVTPWMASPGGHTQPWTIFTDEGGKNVLAINFDWIHRRGAGFSTEAVDRFAERIAALPSASEPVEVARLAEWRKRPSLSAEQLFADPNSLAYILEALDELYADAELD